MVNVPLLCILAGLAAVMMLLEWRGAPVVLNLNFKGDVKRESRWFAQYGQGACTLVAAGLIWRMDHRVLRHGAAPFGVVLVVVFGISLICTGLKRLLGRVRPGREHAGRFLGPTWRHANYRESFPSSHSACAVALSVVLSGLYPPGVVIFWALAVICAVLRYVMDAHWPSDVLGGIAIGYGVAGVAMSYFLGA